MEGRWENGVGKGYWEEKKWDTDGRKRAADPVNGEGTEYETWGRGVECNNTVVFIKIPFETVFQLLQSAFSE